MTRIYLTLVLLGAMTLAGCSGNKDAQAPFVPAAYQRVEKITIVPGEGIAEVYVYRAEVPGGWLYVCNRSGALSSTFVPDKTKAQP